MPSITSTSLNSSARIGKQRPEDDNNLKPMSDLSNRKYSSFNIVEWKLQRCQRRLANMDLESAFERANERLNWSNKRLSDRVEMQQARIVKRSIEGVAASPSKRLAKDEFIDKVI